jgi:hypothetical protein
LSWPKKSRSPARCNEVLMSASFRSAGGDDPDRDVAANPPISPRRSIVTMSMAAWVRSRWAATACEASWIATAQRSRTTYSWSSGGPNCLSALACQTSANDTSSRPSRMAWIRASLTRSLIFAPEK